MDQNKLIKIEKYTLYAAFIPLALLFIVGLFFRTMPNMKLFLEIDLAIVGILLVVSTQVLPEIRLWDYIKRIKKLILHTIVLMSIYLGAFLYFYYSYALNYNKSRNMSNTPIILLLVAIAYQRFNPTDKIVEKYVNSNLDIFPEEKERLEEIKKKREEEEQEEKRRLEEIEKQEAEKRAEIPDFNTFFELDKLEGKEENRKK